MFVNLNPTSGNVLSTVFGVNQTWQNMTSSRALNTNYTNTTGKPIQLQIVCIGGSANSVTMTINGVNTLTSLYTNASGGRCLVNTVIPIGATYNLGDASATIQSWWELR